MKILIFLFLFSITNSQTGTVKFYNEKGFGYIVGKDKIEYFVYTDGLIDEIKRNDEVSFKVRDTRKGLEAYEVRIIEKKSYDRSSRKTN